MGRAMTVLALIFLLAGPARPGVIMEGSEDAFVRKMYIAENAMRVDVREEDGRDGVLVFIEDAGDFSLTVVDEQDGTYYEITPEVMEEVNQQIDQFVEMVERALREVPEGKREQAKLELQLLVSPEFSGILQTMDMEKKVVREESSLKKGSWVYDRYVVYYNDTESSEAWFADVGQFGMDKEDFAILREFDRFLDIPAAGLIPGFLTSEIDDERSVPLRIVEYGEEGEEVVSMSIERVMKEDIDPSVFEIPEGLERMRIEL